VIKTNVRYVMNVNVCVLFENMKDINAIRTVNMENTFIGFERNTFQITYKWTEYLTSLRNL